MLPTGRVEVEGSRIRHVTSAIVRDNGDIIANLALVRIAFERIKRVAHRHVSRPCDAAIGAERIEELRIGVISSVPRVVPNGIEPSIRRYRKRAEPVPLTRINRVVIDSARRAKG